MSASPLAAGQAGGLRGTPDRFIARGDLRQEAGGGMKRRVRPEGVRVSAASVSFVQGQ